MTNDEAAAVTDIGTAFGGSNIKTFNEFEWFTGVQTLKGYAFANTPNLEEVIVPASVTKTNSFIFRNANKVKRIEFKSSDITFSDYGGIFYDCKPPSYLDIFWHSVTYKHVVQSTDGFCTGVSDTTLSRMRLYLPVGAIGYENTAAIITSKGGAVYYTL